MALIIPESLEKANKRQAVRVDLTARDPVRFAAAGQKAVIENLSESGIAFRVEKPIAEKEVAGILKFKIDQVYTLRLTVEILLHKGDSYRARFKDMSPQNSKLMSRLILGLQKLHIRRLKQQRMLKLEQQMADAAAQKAEKA